MVRLAGIEPTTPWFVAKYSIQLSYSRPKHALYPHDREVGSFQLQSWQGYAWGQDSPYETRKRCDPAATLDSCLQKLGRGLIEGGAS